MWVIPIIILGLYLRISFFNVSVTSLPTITDEALNMLMAQNITSFPILFWTQPYQFPLEAYILSLFVDFLPHNAFGARIVLALICWVSLFGLSWIFWKEKEGRFLGILLTAVPSTYLIQRESGILIPQYSLTITFAWLIPLLFNSNRFLLGFISGLALSIHLLSLPIVAGVGISAILRRGRIFYLIGGVIGLIPYLFTKSAYKAVTGTVTIEEAIERLFNEIIPKILPVTAGPIPTYFPDWSKLMNKFSFANIPFQYIFLSLLLLCIFIRLVHVLKTKKMELKDSVLIALVLSLITASFASFGVKYRYLLPVAIYFPFLIVTSYSLFKSRLWRFFIFVFSFSVFFINLKTTLIVKEYWAKPHFSEGLPRNPKLEPLFLKLRELEIRHCYASWWNVYQITWESGGEFVCSQPYNERFPGWPLTPAHKIVRSTEKVGVILLNHGEGGLNPDNFRKQLKLHRIKYKETRASKFHIFHNFHYGKPKKVHVIRAKVLKDEVFHFDTPIELLVFHFDPKKDEPAQVSINVKEGDSWVSIFKRSVGLRKDLNIGIVESELEMQTFSIPPSREIQITIHGKRIVDKLSFYKNDTLEASIPPFPSLQRKELEPRLEQQP